MGNVFFMSIGIVKNINVNFLCYFKRFVSLPQNCNLNYLWSKKYLTYGKLHTFNKQIHYRISEWMNKKLMLQGNVPFLPCGILYLLAQCWAHRPKNNAVLWTWRERAALRASVLLMEKQEFPESLNAFKAKRNKTFRWFSPWDFTPLCGLRKLRTRVTIIIVTDPDLPQNRGNSFHPRQEHFIVNISFPSWVSTSREAC